MRDINRIDKYCAQLAEMWKRLPDWRFTQLLANYARENGGISFYMEDEDFFPKLADYVDRNAPPQIKEEEEDDYKKYYETILRKMREIE